MAATGESGTETRSGIAMGGTTIEETEVMTQTVGRQRGGAMTRRSGALKQPAVTLAVSYISRAGSERRQEAKLPEHRDFGLAVCRVRNGKDSKQRPPDTDAEVRPPSADASAEPAAVTAAPGVEFEVVPAW